jgi:hypothetical protein
MKKFLATENFKELEQKDGYKSLLPPPPHKKKLLKLSSKIIPL